MKKSFGAFKASAITFVIVFLIGMVFVSAGGHWKTIRTENGTKIDILYKLRDYIDIREIDVYINTRRLARNFDYQIRSYTLTITIVDIENKSHVIANITIMNFVEDINKVYTNVPKTMVLKINETIITDKCVKTEKVITYSSLKSIEKQMIINDILGISGISFLVSLLVYAFQVLRKDSE